MDTAPSLKMDTELDLYEMVEETCAVTISKLGEARANVEQAQQFVAEKFMPGVQKLVSRAFLE
jgi:hypothetical protein